MKKIILSAIASLAICAAIADNAMGTLVLEENFADYAKITNGVITIQGTSITPETTRVNNTELQNSMDTNGANNTATITIGGASATVYKTDGLKVENTGTTTSKITIGANNVTVYQKGNMDTLLSGKVGTGTTVAGKALSSNVTLNTLNFKTNSTTTATAKTYDGSGSTAVAVTYEDVGAVPVTRTVAGKPLTGDITLTASDVSALAASTTHLSGDVPTSRTINGKALSSNVTLYGSDIAMKSNDATKLDAAINAKVSLANVKVDNTAIESSTVVELGNCYIKYTTTNGKTTATLYARN